MMQRLPRWSLTLSAMVVGGSLSVSGGVAHAQAPPAQPYPGQAQAQPPYPGQPQPQDAPQPTGPNAGGLYAPPPIEQAPDGRSDTEQQLDDAKEDDNERGLSWFWLDAEGGFQHVGLETFAVDESNLTGGLVPTEASGGFVGAGLGVQLLFLTLGPRFRAGFYPEWQLFSIGGELGFRFPISIVDVHFNLGAGFVGLGSLGGALSSQADAVDIGGPYGRVGGGLDFFIGEIFSIGPMVSWEFMGLTRPGVALSPDAQAQCESDPESARECALEAEGSGFGSAISVGAKLGLHF